MNKYLLIISGIILFGLGAVSFNSCEREKETKIVTIDNTLSDSLRIVNKIVETQLEKERLKTDSLSSYIIKLIQSPVTKEVEQQALDYAIKNQNNSIR